MDRHDLDKMFDALTPDPRRERELLRQLLQDNARRKRPMKNWKRVVVAAAAAALLVTGAAAAVVPGLSQRLLDYLGVAPEDTQTASLLVPGAMTLDITKEDNGAVLHVTQVLRDRTSIMVLADFTAPEGTVLDMDEANPGLNQGFGDRLPVFPSFLDEAGEEIGEYMVSSYAWKVLDDGDPLDNHLSLLLWLNPRENEPAVQNAAYLRVPAVNLTRFDWEQQDTVTVYSGDWSFEAALPQKDIGYVQQPGQIIGELDGVGITLDELYVSPMTLQLTLTRETAIDSDSWSDVNSEANMQWRALALNSSHITLNAKDGTTVTLQGTDGFITCGLEEQVATLRLAEIIDPALLQGGSIALDLSCGTVTIPLDSLVPVEP